MRSITLKSIFVGCLIILFDKSFSQPFPLKVKDHYLIDATNKPFLYHADTGWQLPWKLNKKETLTYLEDRKQKGFNAIQIQILPHRLNQTNKDGQNPFLQPGDLTKPNPVYFDHIEWIVRTANDKGLILLFSPLWASRWEQDWHKFFTASAAENYGNYLANKFKAYPNILWVHGGDDDALALHDAIRLFAKTIKKIAPQQLHTFHGSGKSSSVFFHNEDWLAVNTAYSYAHKGLSDQILADYRKNPVKPTIMGESHYDDNDNKMGPYRMRQQAYLSILSGAAGHAYGHGSLWDMDENWRKGLTAESAGDMKFLKNFFTSFQWQTLIPNPKNFITKGQLDSTSYATFAVAADGSLAVLYLPNSREVDIDLTKLNGEAITAQWYDPTNGEYKNVAGSPFKRAKRTSFIPPTANSRKEQDFVLVLQAQK